MSSVTQTAASEESREGAQRVQMSRSELELYVREGRPTGLLLHSIALLKGLTAAAVAKASGIPEQLVQSIFSDYGLASVKKGAIKRVAGVLGIDLSTMRFAAGQVHIFDLGNIPALTGRTKARQIVRAAGLLARNARVAKLLVGTGLKAVFARQNTYVVQTQHFRALFVSGRGSARFDLAYLPSAQWVRGRPEDSVVRIENAELIANLKSGDLTEGEFDELFLGSGAFNWEDIRVASRVNGVSKADLMKFIESRARELDESEDVEARRVVNENAPFLRLVENDQRVAVG